MRAVNHSKAYIRRSGNANVDRTFAEAAKRTSKERTIARFCVIFFLHGGPELLPGSVESFNPANSNSHFCFSIDRCLTFGSRALEIFVLEVTEDNRNVPRSGHRDFRPTPRLLDPLVI